MIVEKQRKTRGAMPVLYSVHALLHERAFVGSFEAGGKRYDFNYRPVRADIAGNRLQVSGKLTVKNETGSSRSVEVARATLVASQGAVGGATPPRPDLPDLKRDEDEATRTRMMKLAATDVTGRLGYAGVMYIRFEPLDARALAVRANLTRVQLNARMTPTEDTARKLHGIYSAIIDALYGEHQDYESARKLTDELNRLLKL